MFQFPGFALPCLCIQQGVTLARRVSPFRDLRIKAFCQLPVAFRRLTRLSSPVIAKASTTCTYSLDPITLSPQSFDQSAIRCFAFSSFFNLACYGSAFGGFCLIPDAQSQNKLIQTKNPLFFSLPQ